MAITKIRNEQLLVNSDLDANSHKVINLATPTASTDAVTKAYADAIANGHDWKDSVRVATTANIALSGTQTIDGVAVIAGNRVLVKTQTAGEENGIYVCAAGAWARSTDADASSEVTSGMAMFVSEGTANGGQQWALNTADAIALGTTALTFTQVGASTSYSAGDASLTFSGSTIKVTPGTSAQVLMNNGSGVMTPTTVSGDATIASNGAVTLIATVVKTGNYITRETPSGSVNGSNTSFSLANTPVSGTEQVYLNGVLQEPGAGNDYTISSGTITYLTAPITGDRLRVSYLK